MHHVYRIGESLDGYSWWVLLWSEEKEVMLYTVGLSYRLPILLDFGQNDDRLRNMLQIDSRRYL